MDKFESYSSNNALCQVWLNFVQVFSLFYYYLSMEKGEVLHSNLNLESTSLLDVLCQFWLKVVLEKKILKFRQYIFTLLLYLPLNKGVVHVCVKIIKIKSIMQNWHVYEWIYRFSNDFDTLFWGKKTIANKGWNGLTKKRDTSFRNSE